MKQSFLFFSLVVARAAYNTTAGVVQAAIDLNILEGVPDVVEARSFIEIPEKSHVNPLIAIDPLEQ